jgi:hypothetical protein
MCIINVEKTHTIFNVINVFLWISKACLKINDINA